MSLQAGAQSLFLGGGPGFSLLSPDARAVDRTASFYSPKMGAIAHVHTGAHFHDYLSVQAAYVRTRNNADVTRAGVDAGSFFQSTRSLGQHQSGLDFLLYFRDRRSWARPFLSTGLAVTAFDQAGGTRAGIRVAAGIDLMSRSGWGFRYSFLETITGNPLAERVFLRPGGAKLMTFQNLFGVVKYF